MTKHQLFVLSLPLLLSLALMVLPGSAGAAAAPAKAVEAAVLPAVPAALAPMGEAQPATAEQRGEAVVLSNRFLEAHVSLRTGLIEKIVNRVGGTEIAIAGDAAGITFTLASQRVEWNPAAAQRSSPLRLVTGAGEGGQAATIDLEDDGADGGAVVRIQYSLRADEFWVRRTLSVTPAAAADAGAGADAPTLTIDRVVYGAANFDGGETRVLELGSFDRPRLVRAANGSGGVFAGVEHWFYAVDSSGTYLNEKMDWQQTGQYISEPFYLGVFAEQPNDPYPGWAWYKAYLEHQKAAMAKHPAWFSWNAGWGQWGIDIEDPHAAEYLEMMKRIGIHGIIFGSGGFGKGLAKFNELAKTDPASQKNVEALKRLGIAGGTLNDGRKPWDKPQAQAALHEELREHAAAGFGATAFDFFASPDTYTAHRNVALYFQASHDLLDYTECHLGMAAYGPQFQRMVRVNHPDDIHGFDIAHFSSNWATFLAFRDSRRDWQKKYEYLMPEDGLYYFLTHYANWGNPRRYTDPEPQQLMYSVHAYCGLGYNFHDVFGWREAIAASSAFTTAPVFGHIELKMPQRDADYAKAYFAWMADNADVLRRARVCHEDETSCIVSKVAAGDGKGTVHIVNYAPGQRQFRLTLKTGHDGPLSVRQVHPSLGQPKEMKDGDVLEASVRGESTAIYEINGALKSLPPTNETRFPIDLTEWARDGEGWSTRFQMPDVRDALASAADPNLPQRLISIDQVQDSRPDLIVEVQVDATDRRPVVKWIGEGKLPKEYLDLYQFDEKGETVETWKLVPWTFADRVWLVYRPEKPVPVVGPHPKLTIGGKSVEMIPRLDYRPGDVAEWTCPLYHADITGAVAFGGENDVRLMPGAAGPSAQDQQQQPPMVYVLTAADRK